MKLVHIETIVNKTRFSPCVVDYYAVFHKQIEGYDSCNLSMTAGLYKTKSFNEALKGSTSIPPLKQETLLELIKSLEMTVTGVIIVVPENYDIQIKDKEIVIN